MPRFYFHITRDDPHVDDTEGIDLPDRKAARDEATKSCGEMLAEIDGNLSMGKDWVMEVHDNQGPVFRVHFGPRLRRRPPTNVEASTRLLTRCVTFKEWSVSHLSLVVWPMFSHFYT